MNDAVGTGVVASVLDLEVYTRPEALAHSQARCLSRFCAGQQIEAIDNRNPFINRLEATRVDGGPAAGYDDASGRRYLKRMTNGFACLLVGFSCNRAGINDDQVSLFFGRAYGSLAGKLRAYGVGFDLVHLATVVDYAKTQASKTSWPAYRFDEPRGRHR